MHRDKPYELAELEICGNCAGVDQWVGMKNPDTSVLGASFFGRGATTQRLAATPTPLFFPSSPTPHISTSTKMGDYLCGVYTTLMSPYGISYVRR